MSLDATDARLRKHKARAAFISTLLKHKPQEYSIRDFIYLLRACTSKDDSLQVQNSKDALDSNGEFWNQRYHEKEAEASNLRLQLWNLRREHDILKRTAKSVEDAVQMDESTPRMLGLPTKFTTWELEAKEYTRVFPVSENLLKHLKSLYHAKSASQISLSIQHICSSLIKVMEDICRGTFLEIDINNLDDVNALTKAKTRAKRRQHAHQKSIEAITYSIDQVFLRLFNAITNLSITSDIIGQDHINIIKSVLRLFVKSIDCIHDNSIIIVNQQETNSSCATSSENQVKDIRKGLTDTLVSFTISLKEKNRLHRNIVEGMFYITLEAVGKCLCVPPGYPTQALRQTAVYVLCLFKAVLPVHQQHLEDSDASQEGDLGLAAKKKFHDLITLSTFNQRKERSVVQPSGTEVLDMVEKGKQWSNVEPGEVFDMVDEEFANEIWQVLGLEVFVMTW